MTKELSVRQILNRVYDNICGFEIPKNDAQSVRDSKGSPIYGEINPASVRKLMESLDLTPRDVFYDLGSGVGKVVLQAALLSPVKKAVGIELSKSRFDDANIALSRATQFDNSLKKRCQFLNDDLMAADLSKASVIYTCSTAFSQKFMREIAKKLCSYSHRFRVVSLQDFPDERGFNHVETLHLDMSWIRKTPVYIYERTP